MNGEDSRNTEKSALDYTAHKSKWIILTDTHTTQTAISTMTLEATNLL